MESGLYLCFYHTCMGEWGDKQRSEMLIYMQEYSLGNKSIESVVGSSAVGTLV